MYVKLRPWQCCAALAVGVKDVNKNRRISQKSTKDIEKVLRWSKLRTSMSVNSRMRLINKLWINKTE